MRLLNLSVLASLCLSSVAVAQVAPAPAAPAPVKEKKICRGETPLGSIMSRRVCLTKSEWAARNAKNGAAAETALGSVHARDGAGLAASQGAQ